MLDRLSTYTACWYKLFFFIRSRLSCDLTASPFVVIAIRSDTGSHKRLDLIQILYQHTVYVMYIDYLKATPEQLK